MKVFKSHNVVNAISSLSKVAKKGMDVFQKARNIAQNAFQFVLDKVKSIKGKVFSGSRSGTSSKDLLEVLGKLNDRMQSVLAGGQGSLGRQLAMDFAVGSADTLAQSYLSSKFGLDLSFFSLNRKKSSTNLSKKSGGGTGEGSGQTPKKQGQGNKQENKDTGNRNLEVQFTKEQLATKPSYSPVPDKWTKKGGTVKIDEDGTWVYTNKKGQTVRYPDGYPDFTEYSHPTVKPVEIKIASPTNRPLDNKNANKKAGLNKDSDPPVASLNEAPEGYTWHHHQDGKTMILVDKKVHREFTHAGGVSIVNGN